MTYLDKIWRLSVIYSTTPPGLPAMEHVMHLYLNVTSGGAPGDNMADFNITSRGASTTDISDYWATYLEAEVLDLFPVAAVFPRLELWAADEGTANFDFYAVSTIGTAGTGATASIPTMQGTMTFRASNGKGGRVQIMEPLVNTVLKLTYPTPIAEINLLMAHVIGLDSAIVHKSGAFYIGAINYCGNISDALEKRRYR